LGSNVTEPREGEVLAGKYRVDRVLGVGGMGMVLAAHHLGLDTKVAIKLLLPEMLEHKEVVARFAREARAAAKITNDHIARVFDVGALENGAPYLVMEYLDGVDLRQLLQQRGPMPLAQAVDFLLQACEAIGEAHALGIVHRDLKPANLFCVRRPDGTPFIKVLDFGISKVAPGFAAGSHLSVTRTAALMGTPYYMSPEQMESARDVDGRADVWAIGVILFELLTGSVPFSGESLPEVCIKVATQPPPPIRRLRADLPEGVETAILKCLEKDRSKRFASVAELATALARFGTAQATLSAERLSRTSAPGTQSAPLDVSLRASSSAAPQWPESLSALGMTKAGSSRRRWALLGAAAAAALVVSAGVAAALMFGAGWTNAGPSPVAAPAASSPPAVEPKAPAAALAAQPSPPPTAPEALRPAVLQPATAAQPGADLAPAPDEEPPPRTTPRPQKPRKPATPASSPEAARPAAPAKATPPQAPAAAQPARPGADPGANPFDERL